MMKKERSSKWKQLKLLLVLPVIGCALWAFSEPEYTLVSEIELGKDVSRELEIKGFVGVVDTQMIINPNSGMTEMKVVQGSLAGTSLLIKGTAIGTIVNESGKYSLKVRIEDEIVFSHVGYETKVVTVEKEGDLNVFLESTSYKLPDTKAQTKSSESAVKTVDNGEVFFIVEDMPKYKYGNDEFYHIVNKKAQLAAKDLGIRGKVKVRFIVDSKGVMTDLKGYSDNDQANEKAEKIVEGLKEWMPGKQRGKPVSCWLEVLVEF